MFQLTESKNKIYHLIMDGPKDKMHVIDYDFIKGLEKHIDKIEKLKDMAGLIILSKHNEFIAGGDLAMLRDVSSVEECQKLTRRLHRVLRKIETLGKPVVACLNGTTLGGGYEVTLACHYRIGLSNKKYKIGLPEVTLGLLPGAGGTQRLPRMIGIQNSIPYLLQGKTVNPQEALKDGLIDLLSDSEEELLIAAENAIEVIVNENPWDQKGFSIPGGEVQSKSGYMVIPGATAMMSAKTFGNYLAPKNILSCIYEGLQVPIDRALEIETSYFTELVLNPSTKKMIRTLFYSMNECKNGVHRPKDIVQKEIKKVGILGAGMMGAGIAYVSAKAGIQVVLKDLTQELVDQGKDYSAKLLDKAIEKKRLTPEKKSTILDLIQTTTNVEDFKDCDLIIEAVVEDRKIKAIVTKETEAIISENTIFASNTSTLPITGLAKESTRPSNFIGLHFFSPVDKMPLVEVILGEKSSAEATALCLDYIQKINKTPIVVNDGRGFYTSRVFTTYVIEGIKLLQDGVAPALIENAGKQAGMPVGPLAVADEVSIDLIHHILEQTIRDLGVESVDQEIYRTVTFFVKKLGRLGRKSGKGFYEYPTDGNKFLSQHLENHFSISDQQPSVEDVKKRLLYIQSIESLKCLKENVLTTARDGDVGSIIGFGFPAYTGGVFSFIELEGIEVFTRNCHQLARKYGSRFTPPSFLSDVKFYE
ncbi:MAG: 3-hydroxyacyl-CoA dehydrogenase [Bacteriovoracaceae bacterium]|jgi:3-hydroxyacyl-CoA dehydrogenase / enoyl-CoA hydratase / 3-hydroxybutyryl-CoA epimerase|nr:3-hydroxyacyl-CoA dehydrogenase [Bacteriovoracaceae bacterium]